MAEGICNPAIGEVILCTLETGLVFSSAILPGEVSGLIGQKCMLSGAQIVRMLRWARLNFTRDPGGSDGATSPPSARYKEGHSRF